MHGTNTSFTEDEKQNDISDNVETSTALETSSELHGESLSISGQVFSLTWLYVVPEAEPQVTEGPYQGDDLYYDEDADAEWDGTEYDDAIAGEEGADTTFDAEAELELDAASIESSVTLSSRNSKRSIHDVDEDGNGNAQDVTSVQSSPGKQFCILRLD